MQENFIIYLIFLEDAMTYGIKEVAEIVNITENALRYYEKVSVLDDVTRDKNGVRQYSDTDVERIKMVVILRNMGMSVKDVRLSMHQLHDDPSLEDLYDFRQNTAELLNKLDDQKRIIDLEKQHVRDKLGIVDEQIRLKKENPNIRLMMTKQA